MICKTADPGEWDEFVWNHENSTFFHQRAWAELFQSYYTSTKAIAYTFKESSDQTIFVPGLCKKMFKKVVSRFDAGPVGTYGDFLSNQPLTRETVQKVLSKLARKHAFHLYHLSTSISDFPHVDKVMNLRQILYFQESVAPDSMYHKNTVRNITKSKNHNLRVRMAETEEDWQLYYQLYQQSADRWQRSLQSLYPLTFFLNLSKEERLQKKLYLMFNEDQLVYGALVFLFKRQSYYWHGSGNQIGLETGASYALQDHIIRDLWSSGFTFYDMMANGGNDRLYQFKSGFGTVDETITEWIYRSQVYRLGESLSKIIHPIR